MTFLAEPQEVLHYILLVRHGSHGMCGADLGFTTAWIATHRAIFWAWIKTDGNTSLFGSFKGRNRVDDQIFSEVSFGSLYDKLLTGSRKHLLSSLNS